MGRDHLFWFFIGTMAGTAATALFTPLYAGLVRTRGRWFARAMLATWLVLGTVAALGLYRLWGTPDAIALDSREMQLANAMGHPDSTAASAAPGSNPAASGPAGSVEEVTGRLARRLNTQGGSSADWALLAQSYDFLGRSTEAAEARKHAGATAGRTPETAAVAPTVSGEGNALLAQAEKARIAHDYPKALELYAKASKRNALNADAWANYADVAASVGGSLAGAPAQYLEHALALDPAHAKALWLEASLLHEQKRYPQAVATWRKLAAVLPSDSADGRIIAANIAEDQRLGGLSVAGSAGTAPGIARIQGTIDVDPGLRARAGVGKTLFVFAKATDSPGPPLAVMRIPTGQWPVSFTLDDTQAMMPQRKLSDFRTVIVEARVSSSGQAMAQAGDLQGITGIVDPKSGRPLRIVISAVTGS